MATLREILKGKSGPVFTVHPDRTVLQAIETLNERHIGALIVVDDDETIVGIMTERDVLREVGKNAGGLEQRSVRQVMTSELVIGLPSDDVDYAASVMTENRIRHLPVMAGGKLCGIVSIGDVVKAQRSKHEYEAHTLRDYITDRYPG